MFTFLQTAGFQARRFAVVMWSATSTAPQALTSMEHWDYLEYTANKDQGSCEAFIHFPREVKQNSNTLEATLTAMGFSSITLMTFPPNDSNKTVAVCLCRIRSFSGKPEFSYAFHGKQDPALEKKIQKAIKRKRMEDSTLGDFDVVKKRRHMDAAGLATEGDFSRDTLEHFIEFERHTTSALLAAFQEEDVRVRTLELQAYAEQASSSSSEGGGGGVYVARSASIDALKIGCTMARDPLRRLGELSSLVSEPFQLVLWIPCASPFKLEQAIHRHLASTRVHLRGVSTEFFKTDEITVRACAASIAATSDSSARAP